MFFFLFPKNIKKRHDDIAAIFTMVQEKVIEKKKDEYNQFLAGLAEKSKDMDAMKMQINGIFVRASRQIEEITEEGENLHHCVGSYATNVINGETSIFFVRKTEEPEKSFYTLEWKKGKIIQCRGYKNKGMTPEVEPFTKEWEKKCRKTRRCRKEKRLFIPRKNLNRQTSEAKVLYRYLRWLMSELFLNETA